MKKTLKVMAVVGLLVVPLLYGFQRTRSGDPVQPIINADPVSRWETINKPDTTTVDTITATQATLAVNARDYSAVWTDLTDANTLKWDVPPDFGTVDLRWQTTADADSQVIEIWLAPEATYRDGSTESQFLLGAIITLTGGTQVAPNSNVFCDTATSVNHALHGGVVIDGSGSNRVAVYRANLQRYKKVVMIATTYEGSSTIYCDARQSQTSNTNVTVDNATGTAAVEVQMTSPVKTTSIDVIDDWQAVVASSVVVGTAKDISDAYSSMLYVETALVEAVAHGTGAQVIVEVSYADDNWIEYTSFRGTAETAGTTTINDASADAGDSTITLTDATTADFDVKTRKWFILESTYANSESVKTISNATHVVTLAQDMIRGHTDSANVYDRVDEWVVALPDEAAYVRVLVNNDDADCDVAFTTRVSKVTAK